MYFYKLTVAYDGTSYFGWQCQPNLPTVEAVFKEILTGMFHQKKFYFLAASRTDSGVHAHGQVARLGMALEFTPEKLQYIFNKVLPVGISVRAVERVSTQFHAQKNVLYKRYVYTLCADRPLPELERFSWTVGKPLDHERLQAILVCFVGTHDFRLYAKEPGDKITIKTIDSINLEYNPHTYSIRISVQGKSFLHLMIRRIVGASVALCVDNVHDYKTVIHKSLARGVTDFGLMKNLPTAPPQGLCLEQVVYTTKGYDEEHK